MKKSAFDEFYTKKLQQDELTDAEFKQLIIDYLIGFGYYSFDCLSKEQENRAIFDKIKQEYKPNIWVRQHNKRWFNRYKTKIINRELGIKENE